MDTTSKIKDYSLWAIGIIVLINVLLLDFLFVKQRNELLDSQARLEQLASRPTNQIVTQPKVAEPAPVVPAKTPVAVADTSCPQSCINLINVASRTNTVSAPAPISTKGEYFVNLGTGSVTNSEASGSNWKTIDAAQATFDIGNYSNVKSVTLELFLHAATSGEVHARLFDTTTPAVFWSSELSTSSTTSTLLTAPVSLVSGAKTYKIQMYSTLSTGYLDQARLHIVTQ